MGKRALPALALGTDIAATLGLAARAGNGVSCTAVSSPPGPAGRYCAWASTRLAATRRCWPGWRARLQKGMLTLYLAAAGRGPANVAGAPISASKYPATSQRLFRKMHETLYHILWELVHVFFQHKSLLETAAETAGGRRPAAMVNYD